MKRKSARGFYEFLFERFRQDNDIWAYIEALWGEYDKPKSKDDRIEEFLKDKNLEGHPAWNEEGTKKLKYKSWDIWSINSIGMKQWGLFAIDINKKEIFALATQKHSLALDILKEMLHQ